VVEAHQGWGREMSSIFSFLSSSDVFKKEYDMDPKGEVLCQPFNSRDSRAVLPDMLTVRGFDLFRY
jgi:hypothetical protein